MEISFQNRPEDNEPFYDYLVRETKQGRISANRAIFNRQFLFFFILLWGWIVLYVFGVGFWLGMLISVSIFLLFEAHFFIQAGFQPKYFYGKWVYKHNEANIPLKYQEAFFLPKKMRADNDWLEITNPAYSHRFRWRLVEQIGTTTDFIFIHIVGYPVVRIPKRAFATDSKFMAFAAELRKLFEANKEKPIEAD